LGGGERLLLCSDGLWNYAETAEALGALLAAHPGAGPLDLARTLVAHARGKGGHDNVTVAVCEAPPEHADPPQSGPDHSEPDHRE
jgi:serine/threonine protein phosphatase PrpC